VVLGTGNVYGITMIYGGCAALFIPIIPWPAEYKNSWQQVYSYMFVKHWGLLGVSQAFHCIHTYNYILFHVSFAWCLPYFELVALVNNCVMLFKITKIWHLHIYHCILGKAKQSKAKQSETMLHINEQGQWDR
jgi:hypothetical protein